MKESDIQHSIITWLESIGMYVVKVIQTNKNGWPDLQALQNGVTLFIEVKTPTGRLSELQKYRHKQLKDKGFIVITTHSLTHLQHELIKIGSDLQNQRAICNLN